MATPARQPSETYEQLLARIPHPDTAQQVLMDVNEFGTPISVHRCATCNEIYTCCPATTYEAWGDGCLGPKCDSYDIERDVEYLFLPDEPELIER